MELPEDCSLICFLKFKYFRSNPRNLQFFFIEGASTSFGTMVAVCLEDRKTDAVSWPKKSQIFKMVKLIVEFDFITACFFACSFSY